MCCDNGTSVGAALAVACVMVEVGLPHLQALAFVMKRKRNISPTGCTYVQLQELELELRENGTIRT